jgi:hypothetical protein
VQQARKATPEQLVLLACKEQLVLGLQVQQETQEPQVRQAFKVQPVQAEVLVWLEQPELRA